MTRLLSRQLPKWLKILLVIIAAPIAGLIMLWGLLFLVGLYVYITGEPTAHAHNRAYMVLEQALQLPAEYHLDKRNLEQAGYCLTGCQDLDYRSTYFLDRPLAIVREQILQILLTHGYKLTSHTEVAVSDSDPTIFTSALWADHSGQPIKVVLTDEVDPSKYTQPVVRNPNHTWITIQFTN